MRVSFPLFLVCTALVVSMGACKDSGGDAEDIDDGTVFNDSTQTVPGPITITRADPGADVPDAKLTVRSPLPDGVVKEGDSVRVSVSLAGVELQSPTLGEQTKGINYSPDGQHIHVIIDDKPYMAMYATDSFSVGVLSPGAHSLRAFPSRSWHESIKTPGAFVAHTFYVGSKSGTPAFKQGEPLLTYSRPKGEYKGKDAEKILLDFYISNATLAPDKNKVRVTIDGKEIASVTEWVPYYIENLPDGEHTIKLELLAADGSVVPGVYNTAERKIIVNRAGTAAPAPPAGDSGKTSDAGHSTHQEPVPPLAAPGTPAGAATAPLGK
jgi:hypothetical protein